MFAASVLLGVLVSKGGVETWVRILKELLEARIGEICMACIFCNFIFREYSDSEENRWTPRQLSVRNHFGRAFPN